MRPSDLSRTALMSRVSGLLTARSHQSLQRLPAGPEPDVFAVPAARMALDLPFRHFADAVSAQEINEGSHRRQHPPLRWEDYLDLAERRQKVGQHDFQETLSNLVQAARQRQLGDPH